MQNLRLELTQRLDKLKITSDKDLSNTVGWINLIRADKIGSNSVNGSPQMKIIFLNCWWDSNIFDRVKNYIKAEVDHTDAFFLSEVVPEKYSEFKLVLEDDTYPLKCTKFLYN